MNLTYQKTKEILQDLEAMLINDARDGFVTDSDIVDAIYQTYQSLIFANNEADIYDLTIGYKTDEGKTIEHSWVEREKRISDTM